VAEKFTDVAEETEVFKVVRNEGGVLKSAVVGAKTSDMFTRDFTKYGEFELVYSTEQTLWSPCLAFLKQDSAVGWMRTMTRCGFVNLETWRAISHQVEAIPFVVDLDFLDSPDHFKAVHRCGDFFTREVTKPDYHAINGVQLSPGVVIPVINAKFLEHEDGTSRIVRCLDIRLTKKVEHAGQN